MAATVAAASTSRGFAGAGGGGASPARGGAKKGLSKNIRGDRRETQVTLDLHKDGLILYKYGTGLSHGKLSASHPIR